MENLDFCIKALRGAMMLSKQAIQIEIAVCFVVYYNHDGDTGIQAMKALRAIYADAGRVDCLTPGSRSYQTVNRRMRRCGDLYETVSHKKMKRVLKDKHGEQAIEVIKQFIEPYGIESMDDVAAHAGKPREPAEPKTVQRDRRASDAPGVVHVKTRHLDIPIPPDVPKSELLALAKKLTDLAQKMS